MHALEHKILLAFKKEPNREFSTTQMVKKVFTKEYMGMRHSIHSSTMEDKRNAQRKKAELHRRILYHLNKLVADDILKVASLRERGEKQFRLALDAGDYIIQKHKRRIMISKPDLPSLPIDSYEESGIAKRFDKDTWISRMNSILFFGERFNSLSSLYTLINKAFNFVNDTIGISGFERLIQKESLEALTNFINKLNLDTQDFYKRVSINIDIGSINDTTRLIEFLDFYCTQNPKWIHLIFLSNPASIQKNRRLMSNVVRLFSTAKRKINIQNTSLHKVPYIAGRAGIYTFEDDDWEQFSMRNGKSKFVVCGQISIVIDVHKFYARYSTSKDFRTLIERCAKTLMIASRIQRMNSNNYFFEMNNLAEPSTEDTYMISHNYIRLWNYNLEEHKEFIPLLGSCNDYLNIFSKTEEVIYKSCGIPIRFKIVMSSGFGKHGIDSFSQRKYFKRTIRKTSDFEDEEMKNSIEQRVVLFPRFGNADRVRFFRAGEHKTGRIVKEIQMIMSEHNIPLFCYDFAERKGELTLNQFI